MKKKYAYICYQKKILKYGLYMKLLHFSSKVFENEKNIHVKLCDNENIPIKKYSLYLFIKHIPNKIIPVLKLLKKRKNYLIYEPIDIFQDEKNFENYKSNIYQYASLFNHIILNNKYISDHLKINISKDILYHEYDKKCLQNTSNISDTVFYIGTEFKSSFTQKMMNKYGIKYINTIKRNKFIKNIKKNARGIHITYIKPDKTYYFIHTATKLSTCLALNSVFISNRIPIFVELLGKKYELFFKDDLSDLKEIIIKAKKIINNKKLYNDYISKFKRVKEKLSPEYVCKKYLDIFMSVNI